MVNSGRSVVLCTRVTPGTATAVAAWAAEHGVDVATALRVALSRLTQPSQNGTDDEQTIQECAGVGAASH